MEAPKTSPSSSSSSSFSVMALKAQHITPPAASFMTSCDQESAVSEKPTSVFKTEIWTRIPPDLLERIIARLPVTSILRFRTVCKRWNQLPFEKQFLKLQPHQVGACSPFLGTHSDILYIEGSGKWHSIPFNFFPSKHVVLEASGGGILLFSKSNLASRLLEAFFVCNPITKQWCEIKGGLIRFICVTCVDVDHQTLDFNVVVAGWINRSDRHMGKAPLIEIYDSRNHSWSVRLDSRDDTFFQLRGVALIRDTLYLAVYSRNFANLEILSLDMDDRGTKVSGEFGDGSKFHCFGQYRGNLTVVVQTIKVIEIWQLKQQANCIDKWMFLDRLVDEKLNAFSTAAVAGGFVLFNYYDEPIALYNLFDQTWQWVDYPPGRKYWLGMRPLAFEPSFIPVTN